MARLPEPKLGSIYISETQSNDEVERDTEAAKRLLKTMILRSVIKNKSKNEGGNLVEEL